VPAHFRKRGALRDFEINRIPVDSQIAALPLEGKLAAALSPSPCREGKFGAEKIASVNRVAGRRRLVERIFGGIESLSVDD
jgi:hypothetical protein